MLPGIIIDSGHSFLYNEEKILREKSLQIHSNLYYSGKIIVRHNHVYKKLSKFVIDEGKKSRIYYYKNYKKYSKLLIRLIENSEEFKNNFYIKIINYIKNI